jgi:predicted GIY-YIG superfamily endonuclease
MRAIIYAIECEKGHYYIGKTYRQLNIRITEHFNGKGSSWTNKWKPIRLVETFYANDTDDEDILTKRYMRKYGIDKVRGGTYTELNLPTYKIKTLKNEICTANDLCFDCNQPGHQAKNCPNKLVEDFIIINHDSDMNVTSSFWKTIGNAMSSFINFATKYNKQEHESKMLCVRCGRNTHMVKNCYAKTHLKGWYL